MIQNIPCRSIPMPYFVGQQDYSKKPLTFQAHITGNGSISFYLNRLGSPYNNTFYINKKTAATGEETGWQLYTSNATGSSISLFDGDTVAFSGTSQYLNKTGDNNRWHFYSNNSMSNDSYLEVYGNINSLTNYQPIVEYNYRGLFYNNFEVLSSAWNMHLPSANPNGTEIPQQAYACLFRQGSTSIGPKMIHIKGTMSNQLFDATFYQNTKIKYAGLDCSNYGTDNLSGTQNNWFESASSTGVFVRTYPTTPYIRGKGQIPNGWTVIDLCEDRKYYLDNNGTPTSTQVIVNPDGTYTTV